MKFLTSIGYLSLSSFLLSANLLDKDLSTEIPNVEGNPVASQDLQQWISQLKDLSFKRREEASNNLWKLGKEALPSLRKSLNSSDPEQAARAEVLIRNIEAGVLPDTPQQIIDIIDKYRKATTKSDKIKALRALVDKNSIAQALYLLHWEENEKLKESLTTNRFVRGLALRAAHQALSDNDVEQAIRLLRIAPPESFNRRSLAFLMLQSGVIDAEIEKNGRDLKTPFSIDWQLILLRAKGDLPALEDFAIAHESHAALATISLLKADARPMLHLLKSRSSEPTQSITLDLLNKHFNIDALAADFDNKLVNDKAVLAEVVQQLNSNPKNEANAEYAARLTMLLGFRQLGESKLADLSDITRVTYYSTQGNYSAAYKYFNAPDPRHDKQAFSIWLETEIKKEIDEDTSTADGDLSNVLGVAGFFLERGNLEIAKSTVEPLLKALKDDGSDRWYSILQYVVYAGHPELALQWAVKRGNKNEEYRVFIAELFGNTEDTSMLRDILLKMYPDDPDDLNLRRLLNLFTPSNLPNSESTMELQQSLLDYAKKFSPKAHILLLESLVYAANTRGDLHSVMSLSKALSTNENIQNRKKHIDTYLLTASAQFNHAELIAAYDLDPSRRENSPIWLTRYAMAKRALGEDDVATKFLNKAILRTLGSTKLRTAVAEILYEYGHTEEAYQILRNTLLQLNPSDWEFFYTLNFINHQLKRDIHTANWPQAHAFALAELAAYTAPAQTPENLYSVLRASFTCNFTYGMAALQQGEIATAKRALSFAHDTILGDGSLADDFFPALLDSPFQSDVDSWFNESWGFLQTQLVHHPDNHIVKNTAAWLAGRACRNLDAAEQLSKQALASKPEQSAYLDTLAEVYFAQGNRKLAVQTSQLAVDAVRHGREKSANGLATAHASVSELLQQQRRFKNTKFPSIKRLRRTNK